MADQNKKTKQTFALQTINQFCRPHMPAKDTDELLESEQTVNMYANK